MLRSLADVQAEFAAALRDPDGATPADVAGPDGRPAPRRFAVYRNNVIAGLIGAVSGAFPAVKRIVGDHFFDAMARAYVLAEPPRSPVLMDYGEGFADFIAAFEPAASLPYLADVARIERAWREAYHAAEAVALGPTDFAGIGEEDLSRLTFTLHPSLRILHSDYPALKVWRMNASDEPLAPIDFRAGGEDTLIVRPGAEVVVRLLPPGGYAFIAAFIRGGSLGEAAAAAMAADSRFDLALNIAGLIESGVVVGYSICE
jgi:hypothetical protein